MVTIGSRIDAAVRDLISAQETAIHDYATSKVMYRANEKEVSRANDDRLQKAQTVVDDLLYELETNIRELAEALHDAQDWTGTVVAEKLAALGATS